MKVLIVSFYYSPELGAAPSRITNLAKGLQEKGIEVELLTCMPNYPKGKIFDCVKALKNVEVAAPVHIGDVLVKDVAGTGVDVIATKNVE